MPVHRRTDQIFVDYIDTADEKRKPFRLHKSTDDMPASTRSFCTRPREKQAESAILKALIGSVEITGGSIRIDRKTAIGINPDVGIGRAFADPQLAALDSGW